MEQFWNSCFYLYPSIHAGLEQLEQLEQLKIDYRENIATSSARAIMMSIILLVAWCGVVVTKNLSHIRDITIPTIPTIPTRHEY